MEEKCICNRCRAPFKYQKYLKFHIANVHNKKKDTMCDICDAIFTRIRFQNHYRRVHIQRDREYECQYCTDSKVFAHASNLNQHIRIVNDRLNIYKCDECGKTTKTVRHLFLHINNRHQPRVHQRLFDCEQCGQTFKRKSNVKQHIETFHSHDTQKYRCNRCEKYFKSIHGLNVHRHLLHSTKRFQCDKCNLITKLRSHHLRHIRSIVHEWSIKN